MSRKTAHELITTIDNFTCRDEEADAVVDFARSTLEVKFRDGLVVCFCAGLQSLRR